MIPASAAKLIRESVEGQSSSPSSIRIAEGIVLSEKIALLQLPFHILSFRSVRVT